VFLPDEEVMLVSEDWLRVVILNGGQGKASDVELYRTSHLTLVDLGRKCESRRVAKGIDRTLDCTSHTSCEE
jgi:hypothetical protein